MSKKVSMSELSFNIWVCVFLFCAVFSVARCGTHFTSSVGVARKNTPVPHGVFSIDYCICVKVLFTYCFSVVYYNWWHGGTVARKNSTGKMEKVFFENWSVKPSQIGTIKRKLK